MKDSPSVLSDRCENIRNLILELASGSPYSAAHYGGALSMVEACLIMFQHYLRFEDVSLKDAKRDRFVLSKGHACLALYATLIELGLVEKSRIQFEQNGSAFAGHPVINREYGIDFSTGSLGNGFAYALGSALACPERRVACILGDGELGEGIVSEVARVAGRLSQSNLFVVVDENELQQTGFCDDINGANDFMAVFQAFGWVAQRVDGHNLHALVRAVELLLKNTNAPKVIFARTIKGKGVAGFEGRLESHHTSYAG